MDRKEVLWGTIKRVKKGLDFSSGDLGFLDWFVHR